MLSQVVSVLFLRHWEDGRVLLFHSLQTRSGGSALAECRTGYVPRSQSPRLASSERELLITPVSGTLVWPFACLL